MTEQEQFENWITLALQGSITKYYDGSYTSPDTQSAWVVWQASRAMATHTRKPVAWMFEFPDKRVAPKFDSAPHGGNWKPLYTHPPARVPLTRQEPSAGGVLFAVEEAIRNGDCPWQIEQAFDEYEAKRRNSIKEGP